MTIKQISLSLISLAILVGVSAASYYFVVVQPKQAERERERSATIELMRVERNQEQERQQLYKKCHEQAEDRARAMMHAKITAGADKTINPQDLVVYQREGGKESGMYSRTDYENEFHACLRSNGILDIAN